MGSGSSKRTSERSYIAESGVPGERICSSRHNAGGWGGGVCEEARKSRPPDQRDRIKERTSSISDDRPRAISLSVSEVETAISQHLKLERLAGKPPAEADATHASNLKEINESQPTTTRVQRKVEIKVKGNRRVKRGPSRQVNQLARGADRMKAEVKPEAQKGRQFIDAIARNQTDTPSGVGDLGDAQSRFTATRQECPEGNPIDYVADYGDSDRDMDVVYPSTP